MGTLMAAPVEVLSSPPGRDQLPSPFSHSPPDSLGLRRPSLQVYVDRRQGEGFRMSVHQEGRFATVGSKI